MAFITILTLAGLLGLASFGVGTLPLSFPFSKQHLSWVSRLGTGLLLGTAMGVIIPEGVEVLVSSRDPSAGLPTRTLALSLLAGFSLMLLVEHLGPSAHANEPSALPITPWLPTTPRSSAAEFDVELSQLESEQGVPQAGGAAGGGARSAVPLTIGLVFHGLADGLALGVSGLSSGKNNGHDSGFSELSLVVFIALAVHKAPTALAYTISLLSTTLPRAECQKHLLWFSLATPMGSLLAYAIFYFTGFGDQSRVGIALLVSGGSFLYVATVLQPVTNGHAGGEAAGADSKLGLVLILAGCFIPLLLSSLLGHGHH